jgi:hypothetical protein
MKLKTLALRKRMILRSAISCRCNI